MIAKFLIVLVLSVLVPMFIGNLFHAGRDARSE